MRNLQSPGNIILRVNSAPLRGAGVVGSGYVQWGGPVSATGNVSVLGPRC